jgi:FtsZ-binding cell division protein ZapB
MPIRAPLFRFDSDRDGKRAVEPVDPERVLDRVESLEVSTWEFEHEPDGRHMGPMAAEFYDAFGLGDDDETIATVDLDGVALVSIQALAERNTALADRFDERDDRLDELEAETDELRGENERLREELNDRTGTLERENERLRERLSTIEDRLAGVDDDHD